MITAVAVAISAQAGPFGQQAKAVAVGATAIGFGADVVEQFAKPNVGQTVVNLSGSGVGAAMEAIPSGKVVAPITNELIEELTLRSTNFDSATIG